MALMVTTSLGGMHLQPNLDNGQNLAAHQALFSSLRVPHYRRMQLSFAAQPHSSFRASRIQHEAKAQKNLISAMSANIGTSGKMGPKIRRQHKAGRQHGVPFAAFVENSAETPKRQGPPPILRTDRLLD